MKTVLMVVANNGFQDHEFSATYEALQLANAQITIAAGRKWQCVGVFGLKVNAAYCLEEVKWTTFEMVIFIWWWWALTQYLHNDNYLRIAKEAKKIWAICIAPMIVGGNEAKTFFDGDGFDFMEDSVQLELIKYYPCGKDFVMEYKVIK